MCRTINKYGEKTLNSIINAIHKRNVNISSIFCQNIGWYFHTKFIRHLKRISKGWFRFSLPLEVYKTNFHSIIISIQIFILGSGVGHWKIPVTPIFLVARGGISNNMTESLNNSKTSRKSLNMLNTKMGALEITYKIIIIFNLFNTLKNWKLLKFGQ